MFNWLSELDKRREQIENRWTVHWKNNKRCRGLFFTFTTIRRWINYFGSKGSAGVDSHLAQGGVKCGSSHQFWVQEVTSVQHDCTVRGSATKCMCVCSSNLEFGYKILTRWSLWSFWSLFLALSYSYSPVWCLWFGSWLTPCPYLCVCVCLDLAQCINKY